MRKLREYLRTGTVEAIDNKSAATTDPYDKGYWQGSLDVLRKVQLLLDDDTEAAMANFYAIVDKANNA